MINDLVSENAHRAQDQSDYQKRYEALVDRYNIGEARYNEVTAQLEAKKARLEILRYELETLEKQNGPATEFNEATWGAMVDYATVHGKDDIRFTFRDGSEVGVQLS